MIYVFQLNVSKSGREASTARTVVRVVAGPTVTEGATSTAATVITGSVSRW
jgi:hypothetical protein